MFDLSGVCLTKKYLMGTQLSIDLSEFPNGIYMYQVNSNTGATYEGKIIKEN